MDGFELCLRIVEGGFDSEFSASPNNSYYVETSVEGVAADDDKTDVIKMKNGKVIFDKFIRKSFKSLEPPIPIIISLSMYKRKIFQHGYKLIGTAHFALADLTTILDKSSVRGKIHLNRKKHSIVWTSYLVLDLQLSTIGGYHNKPGTPDTVNSHVYSPTSNSSCSSSTTATTATKIVHFNSEAITT